MPSDTHTRQFLYRLTFLGIAGVIGGVLALPLASCLRTQPPAKDAERELAVSPESLDIGPVWATKSFPWTIRFRNGSARDVAIDSFATSCDCGKVEPPSLTIPAGGEGEIRLTADLFIAAKAGTGMAVPVEFGVSPRIKGREESAPSVWWKVKGTVRHALRPATPGLEFGKHSEYQQPLRPAELALQLDPEVETVEARVGRSDLKADVRRGPAGQASLTLAFPPKLGIGEVTNRVELTPVLSGGKRLPTVTVPVHGAILSDVQATPEAVEFGGLAVGSTGKETITLNSLTGTPFSVSEAKAESDGLSAESADGPASTVYRIRQEVKAVGGQIGRVVFTIQSGGAKKELAVPVRYHGVKAGKGGAS